MGPALMVLEGLLRSQRRPPCLPTSSRQAAQLISPLKPERTFMMWWLNAFFASLLSFILPIILRSPAPSKRGKV